MTISFDKALGIHPQALALREKRGELLAANLANADTPGYKAKDLEFKAILKNTQFSSSVKLEQTHAGHIKDPKFVMSGELKYRNPMHPSLDGNTVEAHIEQAKYSENSLQYQAGLQFLNGKLSGLMSALKGQ